MTDEPSNIVSMFRRLGPLLSRSDLDRPATLLNTVSSSAPGRLEAYWRSIARDGGLPYRSDFDPAALATSLSELFVAERIAPGVARIRVAGQSVNDLMGFDVRGMPLTALFAGSVRSRLADMIETLFSKPAIVDVPLLSPRGVGRSRLTGRLLLLPMRDESGAVTRLVGQLRRSGSIGRAPRHFNIAPAPAPRIVPLIGPIEAPEGFTAARAPREALSDIHLPTPVPPAHEPELNAEPLRPAEPTPQTEEAGTAAGPSHLRLVVSNDP